MVFALATGRILQSLNGLSSSRATWPFALGVSRWQPIMFRVTREVMDLTRFSTPVSVTCRILIASAMQSRALAHTHAQRMHSAHAHFYHINTKLLALQLAASWVCVTTFWAPVRCLRLSPVNHQGCWPHTPASSRRGLDGRALSEQSA